MVPGEQMSMTIDDWVLFRCLPLWHFFCDYILFHDPERLNYKEVITFCLKGYDTVLRTLTSLLSMSNQNGAPMEMQQAPISQPISTSATLIHG